MDWYFCIAWMALLAQSLVIYFAVRNYRYVLGESSESKHPYHPRTALLVPCKGLDDQFLSNIRSFFEQDYDNYYLFFVVESESDPACAELRTARDKLAGSSHALDVQLLVAGPARSSGQKIHNLLYAVQHVPDDVEVLAFADSDACVHRDWLGRLVRPLWRTRSGLATGYRWFVPTQNNLASLGLSAINGAIAQFLGNSPLNHAWGGSMAVRMADFRRLNMAEIWSRSLSDDLSLSVAVKRAGMKIAFVPQCLVASCEATTWPRLYEFGRRQFLITRVYTPGAWWLGLLTSLGSVAGFWGSLALAVHAAVIHARHLPLYAAVPAFFFAGQLLRAVLRQLVAARILPEHLVRLYPAAVADVLGGWFWSLVLFAMLLSSAFGRTIRWRGIRYRLDGPDRTTVLPQA
jgi:cellulose synthase/poly-beta-1,6-N-acetylglucosamine synthase-like glycosyltransferase